MTRLSFIGMVLSLAGNILITLINPVYQVYGFSIFLVSNMILGYVNRKDYNQVILYFGFQILALYAIVVRRIT
jgi:hypothetical protein